MFGSAVFACIDVQARVLELYIDLDDVLILPMLCFLFQDLKAKLEMMIKVTERIKELETQLKAEHDARVKLEAKVDTFISKQ